jgi:hypothetical protein
MIRSYSITLLAGAALLGACQQQPAKNAGGASDIEGGRAIDKQSPPASPTSSPAPTPSATDSTTPAHGENDGVPDITPAKLTGEAAKSEKGARNVLLAWARGIELREFDQAWNLMGDAAKAQQSKAQFNARFYPLQNIAVAVPAGTMEGAAGSSYYTVPATITGIRADGTKTTFKGEVVLRRVNDVPGATAEQLAWHIEQVNLTPA